MKVAKVGSHQSRNKPAAFYLDVDGVLTDGTFVYNKKGKSHKVFGADDSDALYMLSEYLPIHFLSADRRGFEISKARVQRDMGFPLELVPSDSRLAWLRERLDLRETIYMGDGFMDAPILREALIGIAPQNASSMAKKCADHVTASSGGHGAVADACFFVARLFSYPIKEFEPT